MDNKQRSINKMDLLLRGMAKAKGIDPDSQEQQQQRMQDWNEKEVKAVKKMQEQLVDWDKIDQYVAEAGGTSMPGRKEV